MKNININHTTSLSAPAQAVLCVEGQAPTMPSKSFVGKYLETSLVYGDTTTLYIGVGKIEDLDALSWKEIGGTISKKFQQEKITEFVVDGTAVTTDSIYFTNMAQGLALGLYQFSLKSKQEESPTYQISILGKETDAEKEKKAIEQGVVLAEGVAFARTMTNLPANHLRPAQFAVKIQTLLSPLGVECEIIVGDELAKKGLNGLYSIGNSSAFPPQLVIMRYTGTTGKKTALVGKGITFDTGGSDLKSDMSAMQGDMGGAAAVVGAIYSLAKNKIASNVVGVVALAENRLSNYSLVSGDVYTAYNGDTVEVLNTDAEGRLVLADAVAYAVKDEAADEVLDIATLTGAAVRALGFGASAVVSNNCDIWKHLKKSSRLSGERFVRFPDFPEYHKMIESKVADIKNLGGPEGGIVTAGLFIGHFVNEKPWIHLDIAGASWVNKPLFAHQSTGATGTAVDSLYYFCQPE